MQIRDHYEPMRDAEPRDSIELDDLGSAEFSATQIDEEDHASNSGIRQNDGPPLFLFEEDRLGTEMVGPRGIVLLPRDVEH